VFAGFGSLMGTRGGDFKPDPIPPYFGFPNSQTSGAKYGPTPAPGPDGSKTRGFRVHTRPAALRCPRSSFGNEVLGIRNAALFRVLCD